MRLGSQALQKREEVWEQERKTLEVKTDEWKKLYDEVVLKFDAYDVKELKKLKEDSAKWATQRAELMQRLEKLQAPSISVHCRARKGGCRAAPACGMEPLR